MSHYKADSNLSKLNREGSSGFVVVDPSLYEVIQESISFSRHSGGSVRRDDRAPAQDLEGGRGAGPQAAPRTRSPRLGSVSATKRSRSAAPDRIRFRSDCVRAGSGRHRERLRGGTRDRDSPVGRHPARAGQRRRKLHHVDWRSTRPARDGRSRVGARSVLVLRDSSTVHLATERRDPRSSNRIADRDRRWP